MILLAVVSSLVLSCYCSYCVSLGVGLACVWCEWAGWLVADGVVVDEVVVVDEWMHACIHARMADTRAGNHPAPTLLLLLRRLRLILLLTILPPLLLMNQDIYEEVARQSESNGELLAMDSSPTKGQENDPPMIQSQRFEIVPRGCKSGNRGYMVCHLGPCSLIP